MRLKRYRAATVVAAMALIRDELGPEALILGTRRVAGGVEVTVAMQPAEVAPSDPSGADWQPAPKQARHAMMVWHGVPASLEASLDAQDLGDALRARLSFAPLALARPLMLAGPPGAGKTLTVARLATRLVLEGRPPMVITADGQRAGATEQLLAFTRVLGISLIVADLPALVGRAVARRTGEPVLIDLPGLNPEIGANADLVTALAGAAGAATALVLAAGLDANEAADLAAGFAQAGATYLVATRLDLCRRLGGILAAADAGDLTIAEAGVGPGAADGLQALTPAFLAGRLCAGPPSRKGLA